MANITEIQPSERGVVIAPKISARFWMRLITGCLGALFCAAGAAVTVLPFPNLDVDFQLAKFALGVLVFFTGLALARHGRQPPSSELHFHPKFGEFILVPADGGWDSAQCVMSTDRVNVDVSGRYLSVETQDERIKINIAMRDAQSAQRVSNSCQPQLQAA